MKSGVYAKFIFAIFVFFLTETLGILTARRLKELFGSAGSQVAAPTLADFISTFAVATLFLLFVIYFMKFRAIKRAFFKVIFSAAAFVGGAIFFGAWLNGAIPFIVSFVMVSVWWFYPRVLVQDLCVIAAILGAGLSLGFIFPPEMVMTLFVIFSLYDFIAVYLTKHMVVMAKEMLESGAIAAVFIPARISGLAEPVTQAKPGLGNYVILGGGDIVFPLFFSVSLVRFASLADAVTVAIFSLIGFCVSFYLFFFQKTQRPIPALPAIALFSIIGYLLTVAIK